MIRIVPAINRKNPDVTTVPPCILVRATSSILKLLVDTNPVSAIMKPNVVLRELELFYCKRWLVLHDVALVDPNHQQPKRPIQISIIVDEEK